MQFLASSELPEGIIEIRIKDLPPHIRRGLKREKNEERVKLGIAGPSRLNSAQFSISRRGTALIFAYTGPRVSATFEDTILTIILPYRFEGFVDSHAL